LIVLPRRIERRLREEAEKVGVSEEELVLEALLKILNEPLDPDERIEIHLKLCDKYLKDAEDFLAKEDYVQASEKAWGSASQIVKALAAKEGKELKSHRELHSYVTELSRKRGDKEIMTLWFSAISLHQNFYENWLPGEAVKSAIENVKNFIEKMRKYL